MLNFILDNINFFYKKTLSFINIFPIFNILDLLFIVVLTILILLYNTITIHTYIYKCIYLYLNLWVLIIFLMCIGFNQYIIFLVIIEVGAIYFITIFTVLYSNFIHKKYIIYKVTVIITLLCILFLNFNIVYYFNVNYASLAFLYNKYTNFIINQDLLGIFFYFYKIQNYIIIFVSLNFIVITHIIIYIFSIKNFNVTFKNIYKWVRYLQQKINTHIFYEKKINYNIVLNNFILFFK